MRFLLNQKTKKIILVIAKSALILLIGWLSVQTVSAQRCGGYVECEEYISARVCSGGIRDGFGCGGGCPGGSCEDVLEGKQVVDRRSCNLTSWGTPKSSCVAGCNPGLDTIGSCGAPLYPNPPQTSYIPSPPPATPSPDTPADEITYGCHEGQCIAVEGGSFSDTSCGTGCIPPQELGEGCFNEQCTMIINGQGCEECMPEIPVPPHRLCDGDSFKGTIYGKLVEPGEFVSFSTLRPPEPDKLYSPAPIGEDAIFNPPNSPFVGRGDKLTFIVTAAGKDNVEHGNLFRPSGAVYAMQVYDITNKMRYFAGENGETVAMTDGQYERAWRENNDVGGWTDPETGVQVPHTDYHLPWLNCATVIDPQGNQGMIFSTPGQTSERWSHCYPRQLINGEYWGSFWGMERLFEVREKFWARCNHETRNCGHVDDGKRKSEQTALIAGGTYFRQGIIEIPLENLQPGRYHRFRILAAGLYDDSGALDWCGHQEITFEYEGAPTQVQRYGAQCPLLRAVEIGDLGQETEITTINHHDEAEIQFSAVRNHFEMKVPNGDFELLLSEGFWNWSEAVSIDIIDCTAEDPCPYEGDNTRKLRASLEPGQPHDQNRIYSDWIEFPENPDGKTYFVDFSARAVVPDEVTVTTDSLYMQRYPKMVWDYVTPEPIWELDGLVSYIDFSGDPNGSGTSIELSNQWQRYRGSFTVEAIDSVTTKMYINLRPLAANGGTNFDIEYDDITILSDIVPDKVELFRGYKQEDTPEGQQVYCNNEVNGETNPAGWSYLHAKDTLEQAVWEKNDAENSPIEHLGNGLFSFNWDTSEIVESEDTVDRDYVLIAQITPGSNKLGEEYEADGTPMTCTGNPGSCFEVDPKYANCSLGYNSDGTQSTEPFTPGACNTSITLNACDLTEPERPIFYNLATNAQYNTDSAIAAASTSNPLRLEPTALIPEAWEPRPDSFNRAHRGIGIRIGEDDESLSQVQFRRFDVAQFSAAIAVGTAVEDIPTVSGPTSSINLTSDNFDEDNNHSELLTFFQGTSSVEQSNENVLAVRAVNNGCGDEITYSDWTFLKVQYVDEIALSFYEADTDQCLLDDSTPLGIRGTATLNGQNLGLSADRALSTLSWDIGSVSDLLTEFSLDQAPISKENQADGAGNYSSFVFNLSGVSGNREMEICSVIGVEDAEKDANRVTIDNPLLPSRYKILLQERLYENWWQTQGGLVFADSTITSLMPLRLVGGNYIPSQDCGNSDICYPFLVARNPVNSTNPRVSGVPISNQSINVGTDIESYFTHRANDSQRATRMTSPTRAPVAPDSLVEDYYDSVMAKIGENANTINWIDGVLRTSDIIDRISNPNLMYDEVGGKELYIFLINHDSVEISITESLVIEDDTQVLILAREDLTVNRQSMDQMGRITVEPGGFLGVFADGNIYFAPWLGDLNFAGEDEGTETVIEGVFIADETLAVQGGNRKFIGAGVFAGLGNVTLARELLGTGNSSYIPTETFIHRPDFAVNAPEFLKDSTVIWREVN